MPLRGHPPEKRPAGRAKILVYGRSGVGKTWLALDFPKVYFLDTEGGAKESRYVEKLQESGGLYLGPEDGANTFPVVLEELRALATAGHDRRTVVIDSYSKLWNTQIALDEEDLTRRRKSLDYGAANKNAARLSARLIQRIDQLDMNVLLIAHTKPSFGDDSPDTFDGWRKLDYELDLTLEVSRTGTSRRATVVSSRISDFPVGSTFPWTYQELESRFGQERLEAAAAAAELATPEQVARLEELIAEAGLDEAKVEKLKERLGSDEFAGCQRADVEACISALERRLTTTATPEQVYELEELIAAVKLSEEQVAKMKARFGSELSEFRQVDIEKCIGLLQQKLDQTPTPETKEETN